MGDKIVHERVKKHSAQWGGKFTAKLNALLDALDNKIPEQIKDIISKSSKPFKSLTVEAFREYLKQFGSTSTAIVTVPETELRVLAPPPRILTSKQQLPIHDPASKPWQRITPRGKARDSPRLLEFSETIKQFRTPKTLQEYVRSFAESHKRHKDTEYPKFTPENAKDLLRSADKIPVMQLIQMLSTLSYLPIDHASRTNWSTKLHRALVNAALEEANQTTQEEAADLFGRIGSISNPPAWLTRILGVLKGKLGTKTLKASGLTKPKAKRSFSNLARKNNLNFTSLEKVIASLKSSTIKQNKRALKVYVKAAKRHQDADIQTIVSYLEENIPKAPPQRVIR